MTKLQIKTLNSTECITCEQQKQVNGGKWVDYSERSVVMEDFFGRYANGELDLGKVKTTQLTIEFIDPNSRKTEGAIFETDDGIIVWEKCHSFCY